MAKRKEKTDEEVAPVVPAPAAAPAPAKKSAKIPKLAPKKKSRLPRRQKKAQKKAATVSPAQLIPKVRGSTNAMASITWLMHLNAALRALDMP